MQLTVKYIRRVCTPEIEPEMCFYGMTSDDTLRYCGLIYVSIYIVLIAP